MDVQGTTDKMIRIARVMESYSEPDQLSRLVSLADDLYRQARYELAEQTSQGGAVDSRQWVRATDAEHPEDVVDLALDATPLGMAYHEVVRRAWYLACG
ncbi:hypothetical protein AB0912_06290 [Streptomyces sp. NPDC007084]|uniref:hypothetical protein n=1 Tax=Streptomyces sp. NPDC007084 TaxID=3154313 RepID=UPI00345690F4